MQLDAFNFDSETDPPLAAKLRPKSLEDFYGQTYIRPQLEKLISHPRHVIFWGPPGTGKTTLAFLISAQIKRELHVFSAVTSGIPELKKLIAEMLLRRKEMVKKVSSSSMKSTASINLSRMRSCLILKTVIFFLSGPRPSIPTLHSIRPSSRACR